MRCLSAKSQAQLAANHAWGYQSGVLRLVRTLVRVDGGEAPSPPPLCTSVGRTLPGGFRRPALGGIRPTPGESHRGCEPASGKGATLSSGPVAPAPRMPLAPTASGRRLRGSGLGRASLDESTTHTRACGSRPVPPPTVRPAAAGLRPADGLARPTCPDRSTVRAIGRKLPKEFIERSDGSRRWGIAGSRRCRTHQPTGREVTERSCDASTSDDLDPAAEDFGARHPEFLGGAVQRDALIGGQVYLDGFANGSGHKANLVNLLPNSTCGFHLPSGILAPAQVAVSRAPLVKAKPSAYVMFRTPLVLE